jgi:2-oxoisovalerate dehydrogenase E1 component
MGMSAMDQIKQLWGKDDIPGDGGLPILFNIFNNFYGMGGQTCGETMGYGMPARLGAGFDAYNQMHAESVNGYNPFAVIVAVARKKKLLLEGSGPALLEVKTYRTTGHSPSDSSTYRTQEEIEAWREVDAIPAFAQKLILGGIATNEEIAAIDETIVRRMVKVCRLATDDSVSPRMDMNKNPEAISSIMFSNQKIASMDTTRKPDVLMPKEENPRVKQLAGKARFAFDENGKAIPKTKLYGLRDGLFEAIIDKYYEDPTLISYGEDVRDWGGAYAVYRGLTEAIPYHRLFNAPIS